METGKNNGPILKNILRNYFIYHNLQNNNNVSKVHYDLDDLRSIYFDLIALADLKVMMKS